MYVRLGATLEHPATIEFEVDALFENDAITQIIEDIEWFYYYVKN